MSEPRIVGMFHAVAEEFGSSLFKGYQAACDVVGKNPAVRAVSHSVKSAQRRLNAMAAEMAWRLSFSQPTHAVLIKADTNRPALSLGIPELKPAA